jgi:hypothetical protein
MLFLQASYGEAMPRRVRALQLNLLVLLDAVVARRSIAGAASGIGLSQPATGAALSDLLQDDPHDDPECGERTHRNHQDR